MKRKILCISSIIASLSFASLAFSDPTNVPSGCSVSTFANISGGNCIAVLTPPSEVPNNVWSYSQNSYIMTEFNNNWSGSISGSTPSGNYIAVKYWNPALSPESFTKPIQISGQNSYQITLCGNSTYLSNLTFDISPTQITLLGTNIVPFENGMTPSETFVVPGMVSVTLYSNGDLIENYNNQFTTLSQNVASFQLVGNDILNASYNDGSSKIVYYGNNIDLNDIPSAKPLNLSVNEISPSPNNTNNAIYNMTIPSSTVDGYLLNTLGLNGFFYNVTIKNNSSTTTKKEYPLVGGILNTSGNSLTIKPISFEMEGPKYSGSGVAPTVNVQLEAQPQASLSPITIASGTATLPQFVQPTFDPSKYTISIDMVGGMEINNQISVLNNYTCGTPFLVQIQDHSDNVIPSTSPLYNDIVFYTNRSNSTYDSIIGANPQFIPDGGGLAILPSSVVENANSDVKYGVNGESIKNNYGDGKLFYMFAGSNVVSASFNTALFTSGSDTPATESTSINVINVNAENLGYNASQEQDSPYENFILQGPDFNNSTSYLASNIYGENIINQILPNYAFDTVNGNSGIFFLPNEGLASQNFQQRFNWSSLVPGYNIEPCNFGGVSENSKLESFGYQWQSTGTYTFPPIASGVSGQTKQIYITNFNDATRGKQLYAYLFSSYGTIHIINFYGGNELVDLVASAPGSMILKNATDSSQYVTTGSYSLFNEGIPESHYGIFLPPNSTDTVYANTPNFGKSSQNNYFPDLSLENLNSSATTMCTSSLSTGNTNTVEIKNNPYTLR